jgi:hypothetical protein
MKGNESDCICEKPKGKHRKHCDAYRLKEFMLKAASVASRDTGEGWIDKRWKDHMIDVRAEITRFMPKEFWSGIADLIDSQLPFVSDLLTEAESRGRKEGYEKAGDTHASRWLEGMDKAYEEGYQKAIAEIRKLPIERAHTYSSENADMYRTFDAGQEHFKNLALKALDSL